jgi:glycosyltransferase involved in cell wall biosynthesis
MEGQSLALTEAMRSGRPAIVTRVGGADELVEEGLSGFIADHPSPEHLEAAMERAWEARFGWKSMGEHAARTIMEKFPEDPVGHFNAKVEKILIVK